jgi:hypothetical protein
VLGNDATAALGTTRAFKTMQAAVNACKAAHDVIYGTLPPSPPSVVIPPPPMNARQGFVIDVAPYTAYDEDVVIDITGAFHLMITGEGGWDLGVFDGSVTNWQPQGAPSAVTGVGISSRSITITGNPYVNTSASPNLDIRPSVIITSKARAPWHGTNHLAWWGPRIAGRVLFDLPNQGGAPAAYGGNVEVVLDCEVHGNGFANAVDCINTTYAAIAPGNNPLTTVELNRCRFRKAANFGTSALLAQAIGCRFDGLLSTGTYGAINLCRFNAGWTATAVGLIPTGVFSSYLAGTFTGNAGQKLRIDLASNTSLVENGNAVVGWTKTLLNDATL